MISIDGSFDSPCSSPSVAAGLSLDPVTVDSAIPWICLGGFAEVKNPWLTLKGERWRDNDQRVLDYWRVEKADSLILLPQQGDRLLLPKPVFRPGIGEATWDFPGGRLTDLALVDQTLRDILQRELALSPTAVLQTRPINPRGWAVNSSFSNQKLYGYWVNIDPDYELNEIEIGAEFEIPQQLPQLLNLLSCLQCRALLREWQCLTGMGM